MAYTPADTLVRKDSLNKKQTHFQSSDEEIEITFNDPELAEQNVRNILNELFDQYLTVKDALVYNDAAGAVNNTLKLLDDMKSKTKNVEVLNKDYRWLLFVTNFDNIRNKVASTNTIREQRFMFNEITTGLSVIIKQYGLNDRTVYLMQCNDEPSGGSGKWFSGARDKKNPYLGTLNDTSCVKVKEVWKF